MLRGLIYYGRVHLAVLLGAAVATAVLTGALLVGDSVRGSLRDLALDRLGDIDRAILSERFFREELATDLAAGDDSLRAAPAVLLQGAAVHADSGARASGIQVLGVDERFLGLFPAPAGTAEDGLPLQRLPGQIFSSAVLNVSLAEELGAAVGDAVLLSYPLWSEVPADTLLGGRETQDVVGTLRCTVTAIIPDRGMGRFGLAAHQTFRKNAFVALGRLQRALGAEGQVNGLFVTAGEDPGDGQLTRALQLEDLGLRLVSAETHLNVESREFVLRPGMVQAVKAAAAATGATLLPIQTYLANDLQVGDRIVPYSMVAALEPPSDERLGRLRLTDGTPAPALASDEILLNRWAADDLGARPGDEVGLSYYVVGPREELLTRSSGFRLRGIVAMEGLGADRALTPDYPGIQGADDMSEWDPPFPVDLDRVRPADEDYWDRHAGSPKAFVSEEAGRELWSNRFGTVTAVRIAPPAGEEPEAFLPRFREALLPELAAAGMGLRYLPVRAEGLEAAQGATDFSGLFIGFSLFLIVSAVLLVSLLFRLGVEQRAREVGLLLAVGYRVRAVRRRFLAEGGIVAAAGVIVGLGGAVLYAWLMMAGLRTVWLPAVGSPLLFLHVKPLSLAMGGVLSLAVVLGTVAWSVRRLGRIAPTALLAGSLTARGRRSSGWLARIVLYVGVGMASGTLASAAVTGQLTSPGLFFGIGASLLCAGLAAFSLWCRGVHRSATSLRGMAVRNSSWNPGRSILSVALVGCASFSIVSVTAFHLETGEEVRSRTSGAGGFAVLAESDVPLPQAPDRREARLELGFPEAAEADLADVEILPFRTLPGDDASCLNLYRPGRPRILGVPPELIRRGGFRFSGTLEETENPWSLLERDLGPGVIPAIGDANSVQWILHLGLGKDLVLVDERGEEVRLRLVGLLSHSLFQSELLISEERFLEHFPSRSGYSTFLVDPPEGTEERTTEVLESALAPFGFDATSTAEKLAGYNAVQNTYLSTFQTLGGLGLLLGTVGLGIILVRNVMERRGELAAMRAFGFRRGRLALLVLAENLFLLLFGILVGAGSAAVAIIPALLGRESPIPWASLLTTLAVVFLVGMLSSVAAVAGTLRVPLLPALKAER